MSRAIFIFCVFALVPACQGLPANVERQPSHALPETTTTPLGKAFAAEVARHEGASGFLPVVSGTQAWLLRAAFTGLAARTLDLQYYLWEDDITGRMLLRDVMSAAARGVRVRVLLDDVHTEGKIDTFGILDAFPGIEVRIFNPFANRDLRSLDFATRGLQLNHRMHNKLMVVDNALAISGGRNIGDHYFAVDEETNFRDLDLLAAGPVVRDLSDMFDAYWNSEWSYPIAVLSDKRYTPDDARGLENFLDNWISSQSTLPFTLDADRAAMAARLQGLQGNLAWGPARVIYDSPGKVAGKGTPRVAEFLFDTTDGASRELLIETAYFIPGDSGAAILESLVERGIDVRVLTNSLATNDILPAHAAYMKYREPLLRGGVNLYELRPDALSEPQTKRMLASPSKATLHTKAAVYDRSAVFVGSFNLDPRSLLINTEMGVLVENKELANEIARMILRGMEFENSYRLVLRDGDVQWLVESENAQSENGKEYLEREPETGWWNRFLVSILALFPIDGQL